MAVKFGLLVRTALIGASLAPGILLAQEHLEGPLDTPPAIEFGAAILRDETKLTREIVEQFPSAVISPYPANNQVTLHLILPKDSLGPCPVVILLHYWGASDWRAERAAAAKLAEQGIGAALMALPYHLERTPEGTRSGELAIQADPHALGRTMTQAVLDIRRSVDWLEQQPDVAPDRIGIAGTSLGAVVGSLAFAVEPRLKAGAFILGGVDLAGILWHSSRVVQEREQLRSLGYTEDRLRAELQQVEPSNYLERRHAGPAFVVGARYDTVIPRASTDKLLKLLPDAKALWIDTGHYGGAFLYGRLSREVAQFFAQRSYMVLAVFKSTSV